MGLNNETLKIVGEDVVRHGTARNFIVANHLTLSEDDEISWEVELGDGEDHVGNPKILNAAEEGEPWVAVSFQVIGGKERPQTETVTLKVSYEEDSWYGPGPKGEATKEITVKKPRL